MSTTAHFTLEQFELMAASGAFSGRHHQRVELIRGEILQMSPLNEPHCWIVDQLTRWSTSYTDPEQVWVRIQGTLKIQQLESAPQPDVQLLAMQDYSGRHPTPADVFLLVEVADSSLDSDLRTKAELHAEAGIRDYWVVNIPEESVVVFREPDGKQYKSCESFTGPAEIRPLQFPDVALTPASLFQG